LQLCVSISTWFFLFFEIFDRFCNAHQFSLFLPILVGRSTIYLDLFFFSAVFFILILNLDFYFFYPRFNHCYLKMLKALDPMWEYGNPANGHNRQKLNCKLWERNNGDN
jgi:hypothetical protein